MLRPHPRQKRPLKGGMLEASWENMSEKWSLRLGHSSRCVEKEIECKTKRQVDADLNPLPNDEAYMREVRALIPALKGLLL